MLFYLISAHFVLKTQHFVVTFKSYDRATHRAVTHVVTGTVLSGTILAYNYAFDSNLHLFIFGQIRASLS